VRAEAEIEPDFPVFFLFRARKAAFADHPVAFSSIREDPVVESRGEDAVDEVEVEIVYSLAAQADPQAIGLVGFEVNGMADVAEALTPAVARGPQFVVRYGTKWSTVGGTPLRFVAWLATND
jgi:hypothetical protein